MKNSPVKYWYLTLVTGIVVLFCASAGAWLLILYALQANPLTAADMDNIREAVFRHQFQHNASGQQQLAHAYFLSVEDGDPDDKFMERFKDHQPTVKKNSQAKGEFKKEGGSLDGLMFHISAITQISPNKVEVAGGYYESGLSSSGNVYILKRVNNKWIVISDNMLWIS